MAKKITLTVNESLFQKIDAWRSSFNLSRLFQDAVSEAIGRKEELQQRLKGKVDLPQIVERLRAEKRRLLEKSGKAGEVEGSAWAGRAHYEELVAAASAAASGEASAAELSALETWEARLPPSGKGDKERETLRTAYREGWRTGVRGLWDLVKGELGDE